MPHYKKRIKEERYRLYLGRSEKVLKDLPDNFVDSIVCDPPYGLAFMGKAWDYDVPSVKLWKQVFRVLKPGGHLIAFFGTRTYHRGVVNIEDAGFEIRDQIAWVYSSGFPKGLNVSKSIDKTLGTEHLRKVVGEHKSPAGNKTHRPNRSLLLPGMGEKGEVKITTGGSKEAQAWDGWNTSLKPAMEPIVVAMKPVGKGENTARNVMKYGTGAMNIQGCRIQSKYDSGQQGRWPANVIHDGSPESIRLFSSEREARFFFCPKASIQDRDEGLEKIKARSMGSKGNGLQRVCAICNSNIMKGCDCPDRAYIHPAVRKNHHPTVKPTHLMAYLCRLITRPEGIILDPFMGSGSLGKWCKLNDLEYVGIESDKDVFDLATKNIDS